MPKKYSIEGFEQFFNVLSDDNFERLMVDFMQASGVYLSYIKKIREQFPEETKDKLNWEISTYYFDWIDDGKNDMKSITVTNPKTGETKTTKFRFK